MYPHEHCGSTASHLTTLVRTFRYIIGENKAGAVPWKFVYYTGKTLQNTYSGAFVYARTPELPAEAMASVYRTAREAGMEPDRFCRIRNACFLPPDDAGETSSSPAAALASVSLAGSGSDEDQRRFTTSLDAPLSLRMRSMWYDVLDYIEDPHEAARWMFDQQQQMIWKEGDKALSLN